MPTPILEFSHVTLMFDDVVALQNVSFRVEAGGSLVILGAAGCGKSVLLKVSIGLVRPDAGQVYLFGERIDDMPEEKLLAFRQKVGLVFQESALFDSLTVAENVSYPLVNHEGPKPAPQETDRRVREALQFVELEHTLEKLPSELSGGMRRRVAIARAIVGAPKLILYDSPTAGLDPITAHTIMTLVLKERDAANVASLVVTHRLQDGHLLANFRYDPANGAVPVAGGNGAGPHSTRFLIMKKGQLVFDGDETALRRQQDPYIRDFVPKVPAA
jgi:phospholipid/cholesterol/gamma-HCH transport system ATP-binding protein